MRNPVLAKVRTEAAGRSGPEAEDRTEGAVVQDASGLEVGDEGADRIGGEGQTEAAEASVLPLAQGLPASVVDLREQEDRHDDEEEEGRCSQRTVSLGRELDDLIGRGSGGSGDARGLSTRWRLGKDDAGQAEQTQEPNHHPRQDMACSQHGNSLQLGTTRGCVAA